MNRASICHILQLILNNPLCELIDVTVLYSSIESSNLVDECDWGKKVLHLQKVSLSERKSA